jgi:hypothetical protein
MSEELYNTASFADLPPPVMDNREVRLIISQPQIDPSLDEARHEVVARITHDYTDQDGWLTVLRREIEAGNSVLVSIVSPDLLEEDFDFRVVGGTVC